MIAPMFDSESLDDSSKRVYKQSNLEEVNPFTKIRDAMWASITNDVI